MKKAKKDERVEDKSADELVPATPYASLYHPDIATLLHKKTPPDFVAKHEFSGLNYVEVGYMRRCIEDLCDKLDALWSFEVFDVSSSDLMLKIKHIVVKGRLMLFLRKTKDTIVREQYGGSEVKCYRDDHKTKPGEPMDLGNDFKSAASDAFKKCLSTFGVAQDIYEPKVEKKVEKFEAKQEAAMAQLIDAEPAKKPNLDAVKPLIDDPEAKVTKDQVGVIIRFMEADGAVKTAARELMQKQFNTTIVSNLRQKQYVELYKFIMSLDPKGSPF